MHYTKWLLCLLFASLASSSYSQSLCGIVKDAYTYQPMQGVVVMHERDTSITDENGVFCLSKPPTGTAFYFSHLGYTSLSQTLVTDNAIYMEPSPISLSEVTVSSSAGKAAKYTPLAISPITSAHLQRTAPFDIADVINTVPGVFYHHGTFSTARLTIRGIGSRTPFGTSKVKMYYEGVPLTDGSGQSTLEDIDQSLIGRMEITKGPTSSIYGAGLGGAVRIFAPAADMPKASYQVALGAFGTFRSNLNVNAKVKRGRVSVFLSKLSRDGYRQNSNYDRSQAGVVTKLAFSDRLSLDVLAIYTKLKAFIPSSINQLDYVNAPRNAGANWGLAQGFEAYDKVLAGSRLNWGIDRNSQLSIALFTNFRDAYEPRPFNILSESSIAIGSRALFIKKALDWTLNLGTEVLLERYGRTTFENEFSSTSNGSVRGSLMSDRNELRAYVNLFSEATYRPSPAWAFSLGANLNTTSYRLDDLVTETTSKYRYTPVCSPKLGVTYHPFQSVSFYGNVAHGFSPPTVDETLTSGGIANPDIRPESGWNYEIGLKADYHRLHLSVAAYWMEIKDLLVARPIGQDEFIGVNAGKNRHLGAELQSNIALWQVEGHLLNWFTNATWARFRFREFIDDGRDFSGNMLTGVPPFLLQTGLEAISTRGLYGSASYRYTGTIPITDDNAVLSEPYQLLDIRIGYKKSITGALQLDAHVGMNNVLNEKYASMLLVNASPNGGALPRYYYPGLPRNMYGGMRLSLDF